MLRLVIGLSGQATPVMLYIYIFKMKKFPFSFEIEIVHPHLNGSTKYLMLNLQYASLVDQPVSYNSYTQL